jgi:phosphoadenosine phosphosulfate reductase
MRERGHWEHTYAEYAELLKLPLEAKIERATKIIVEELGRSKRPALACSWGKCSVTLLHMIRQVCNRVLVVFNDTGVEYPEIYRYRDLLLQLWTIDRYVETKPEKTFWQCVKQFGFPHIRRMYFEPGPDKAKGAPKCCFYLKEQPAKKCYRANKIDCTFVALQATESNVRRLSFLRDGEAFYSVRWRLRVIHPLMIWTDEDIWEYHRRNEIPHNPLYDKVGRSGCMPCTGYRSWRRTLAKVNPKLYRLVSNRMGAPLLDSWDCEKNKAEAAKG